MANITVKLSGLFIVSFLYACVWKGVIHIDIIDKKGILAIHTYQIE